MAEYIEKEMLLRSLSELGYSCCDYWPGIRDVILTESAADVVPVVHGRWEYCDTYMDGMTIFRCTCCGDLQSGRNGWGWKKNYCPNCGARMDGE